MSKSKVEKETVTLAKPHTHRRRRSETGEQITVRPDQAERLRRVGKVVTTSNREMTRDET